MGFADDVKAYRSKSRHTCSVAIWCDTQPADTVAEFEAIIRDPNVMTKAIWSAMRERGFEAGHQPVGRHRKGDCKCPSPTTSTQPPSSSSTKRK